MAMTSHRRSLTAGLICLIALFLAGDLTAQAQPDDTDEQRSRVTLGAEFGFLAPLSHHVQFGSDGTSFDYVDEGGQDNVFEFMRIDADFSFGTSHHITFLYQPIDIQTQVVLRRDIVVDQLSFAEGTPMQLRYSFPYWRLGYHYDFLDDEDRELAVGGALQLRNATIDFKSADGERFRANRGVGPVPLLRFRARLPLSGDLWWGFEADGFYAPVRYLNAGDSDVLGAIVDASLRLGHPISERADAFINLRYLGGGAEGTSPDDDDFGDGYVENWLHFATFSLGFHFTP
jgi:hypothetical protein